MQINKLFSHQRRRPHTSTCERAGDPLGVCSYSHNQATTGPSRYLMSTNHASLPPSTSRSMARLHIPYTLQRVMAKASKTCPQEMAPQWVEITGQHESRTASVSTLRPGPMATPRRLWAPTLGEAALSPSRKTQTPVFLPQSGSPQSSVRLATPPHLHPQTPGTAGLGMLVWA